MPLIRVETSVRVEEKQKKDFMAGISRVVADITGKPEAYMMVTLQEAAVMLGRETGPGAYLDVRGIGGFTPEKNRKLVEGLCGCLSQTLGIPANRIYITFTDVPATNWGWNNATFG